MVSQPLKKPIITEMLAAEEQITPLFSEGGIGSGLISRQQAQLASYGANILDGFVLSADLFSQITEEESIPLDAKEKEEESIPLDAKEKIAESIKALEKSSGKSFGATNSPPLLLNLIWEYPKEFVGREREKDFPLIPFYKLEKHFINLGLVNSTMEAWLKSGADPRQVWDARRRQVECWASMMAGGKKLKWVYDVHRLGQEYLNWGMKHYAELSATEMENLTKKFQRLREDCEIAQLKDDPWEQLWQVITEFYRKASKEDLEEKDYPSVLVREMPQGFSPVGGAGFLQSRIPMTGEVGWHGSFASCAQLDDLFYGNRLPEKAAYFCEKFPKILQELSALSAKLEVKQKEVSKIFFVVEAEQDPKLRILWTQEASFTHEASFRVALDMQAKGILDEKETMALIQPEFIRSHLHSKLDVSKTASLFCQGLPASAGCAVGQLVLFAENAEKLVEQGKQVILVRHETTPEDINGLKSADGVLTSGGGYTSHAALVARGMGKPAIVGVNTLVVDYLLNEICYQGITLQQGDWISMDGATGKVYAGKLDTIPPVISHEVHKVLRLADKTRTLKVRANADNVADARCALENGAEGIGLCRTEHMFFDMERITTFRKMILSDTEEECDKALAELLPLQREDFLEIFRVMKELPVTIRLLDPPLHEFLPRGDRSRSRMSKAMGLSVQDIQRRIDVMAEQNPMMGRRGCRLAFTNPGIYKMQTRAIVEAVSLASQEGIKVKAEIMIPLVSDWRELWMLRSQIDGIISEEKNKELSKELNIEIGAMIETPRAALCADELAKYADFLSFGTNDLTQMTYGISRDDTESFLPTYFQKGILDKNPFVNIDVRGVGELLDIAVQRARSVKENIKLGICGEHGGDAYSVRKFHKLGLDYVSCSPFRLLEARLVSAPPPQGQSLAEILKRSQVKSQVKSHVKPEKSLLTRIDSDEFHLGWGSEGEVVFGKFGTPFHFCEF